jgi:hypothetical protein
MAQTGQRANMHSLVAACTCCSPRCRNSRKAFPSYTVCSKHPLAVPAGPIRWRSALAHALAMACSRLQMLARRATQIPKPSPA